MPRAGWTKPDTERRLADLVSVGLLTRVFPPDVVDEVIVETGRKEQRHRSLPARVMAYFAVGMALHSEGSYEDVLGLMTDGLSWSLPEVEPVKLPTKSAIFQARDRLGAEPVKALFERVAQPLAIRETPGSWLAGRRLVAIDGTTLDVADTAVNEEYFGRPGVNKGERSAFPQIRVVGLAECGTHATFAAVIGPYTTGENTLARDLVAHFEPGMLVLADRGFCGFPLWSLAVETGADLLWRASSVMKPRPIKTLPDGSWLAEFRPSGKTGRDAEPLTIRVIDYQIDDGRGDSGPYRLFTTLLDPIEAPAQELTFAYAQRWEIEIAFDELKTHQRGPKAGAFEVPGPGRTRSVGPSVLPLRHPNPHVRSCPRRRRRPRPGLLHRSTSHHSTLALTGARFFPLWQLTGPGPGPSSFCAADSTRHEDAARTRA